MEIKDLTIEPSTTVTAEDVFTVRFTIIGALPSGFTFPFSNESLEEKLLQFVKEGIANGG